MDIGTSASVIPQGSTNMTPEIAQSTLLQQTWKPQYVHSNGGIGGMINYGGLTLPNFCLVTSAIQPAPVPSGYSTALKDIALSTITGAFHLPECEIATSQITSISPETLGCHLVLFDHRTGM
jgi:hypothetical protein